MPAAADPDVTWQVAKAVADLYADAAHRMLQIVASRLARGIDTPGWAEAKLVEVVRLRDEAQRLVDRLEVMGPRAIVRAVEGAWLAGSDAGVAEVGAELAGVDPIPKGVLVATDRRAVEALAEATVNAVRATHTQILRSTVDVYRAVIAETSAPGVVSGTEARRAATQRALDRFAARGVTAFVDSRGARWSMESYAEMATRTAVGQAQVEGTLARFGDAGRDLVIVSDAPQECKACRPWEGRVLSVSGGDGRYPSLAEARSAGLLHANCRHRLGAYIEGLTRPFGHTADPEGDAARQELRRLERGIRAWKARAAVALDDPARKAAEAKVREWQGRLREHVATSSAKRIPAREQIGRAR